MIKIQSIQKLGCKAAMLAKHDKFRWVVTIVAANHLDELIVDFDCLPAYPSNSCSRCRVIKPY